MCLSFCANSLTDCWLSHCHDPGSVLWSPQWIALCNNIKREFSTTMLISDQKTHRIIKSLYWKKEINMEVPCDPDHWWTFTMKFLLDLPRDVFSPRGLLKKPSKKFIWSSKYIYTHYLTACLSFLPGAMFKHHGPKHLRGERAIWLTDSYYRPSLREVMAGTWRRNLGRMLLVDLLA